MDDCLAISLLRHGVTKENQRSAYIGWTDFPLCDEGREELYRMQVNTPTVELLFSSDLIRCRETAMILYPNQPIHSFKHFREIHFGLWEGKTYDELKDMHSYRKWLDHPFTALPDGGESFAEFSNRIETGFMEVKQRILSTASREIAIVTHGGVIRYLLSAFSGQNRSFFDWKFPYGGGYRMHWTKDSFRRGNACMALQEVPITENPHG